MEREYYTSLYPNDPTECNDVDIDYCRNCQNNAKYDDTDVCEECIEDFDKQTQISLCCGDNLHTDTNRCMSCYEWSESLFDEFCEEHNFDENTFKFKPKNK